MYSVLCVRVQVSNINSIYSVFAFRLSILNHLLVSFLFFFMTCILFVYASLICLFLSSTFSFLSPEYRLVTKCVYTSLLMSFVTVYSHFCVPKYRLAT